MSTDAWDDEVQNWLQNVVEKEKKIINIQFFAGVEKLVLHSLTSIVEEHIPQLTKDKKTLTSLLLDYDAAKSRLVQIQLKLFICNFINIDELVE